MIIKEREAKAGEAEHSYFLALVDEAGKVKYNFGPYNSGIEEEMRGWPLASIVNSDTGKTRANLGRYRNVDEAVFGLKKYINDSEDFNACDGFKFIEAGSESALYVDFGDDKYIGRIDL